MRLNVVTFAFSASFLGLSEAGTTKDTPLGGTGTATEPTGAASSTSIVKVWLPLPTPYQAPYVIQGDGRTTTLDIEKPGDIFISKVALKVYNKNETDGHKDDYVISGSPPGPSQTWIWDLDPRHNNASIQIRWDTIINNETLTFRDLPVYIECEWASNTDSGSSTSQLFAVYKESSGQTSASANLRSVPNGTSGSPARAEMRTQESSNSPSPAPSSTNPQEPTTSPTSNTGQPPTTIGPQTSTSPTPSERAPNGLSQGGKIGIAVGISVAGLLVAAVVSWLLCLRRRRRHDRNLARHGMSSYESDVGAHAMMADKDVPMRLESSSRQSAYGVVGGVGVGGIGVGVGGDGGRASTEQHQYAPYSDRSATTVSPTPFPQQQQPQHGTTTMSADTTVVEQQQQQQGDLGRGIGVGGGNAPASVPGAPTSYVHLIEDGMTAEEIRRLEEEERQLDAAIENAGIETPRRRGDS